MALGVKLSLTIRCTIAIVKDSGVCEGQLLSVLYIFSKFLPQGSNVVCKIKSRHDEKCIVCMLMVISKIGHDNFGPLC